MNPTLTTAGAGTALSSPSQTVAAPSVQTPSNTANALPLIGIANSAGPSLRMTPNASHVIADSGHQPQVAGNLAKVSGELSTLGASTEDARGCEAADGWTKVGEARGSTSGGVYRDAQGHVWYVKTPANPDIVRNEVLASKLYRELGIPVANVKTVSMNGGMASASQMIRGLQNLPNDSFKQAGDGFVVDAWLANWDVAATGNIKSGGDQVLRMEVGGALRFRAMGEPKGDAFGPVVGELDTLRDPTINKRAARLFATIDDQQLHAGIERIACIPDVRIERLVDAHGPGDAQQRSDLAQTLIARKRNLVEQLSPPDGAKVDASLQRLTEERLNRTQQALGAATRSLDKATRELAVVKAVQQPRFGEASAAYLGAIQNMLVARDRVEVLSDQAVHLESELVGGYTARTFARTQAALADMPLANATLYDRIPDGRVTAKIMADYGIEEDFLAVRVQEDAFTDFKHRSVQGHQGTIATVLDQYPPRRPGAARVRESGPMAVNTGQDALAVMLVPKERVAEVIREGRYDNQPGKSWVVFPWMSALQRGARLYPDVADRRATPWLKPFIIGLPQGTRLPVDIVASPKFGGRGDASAPVSSTLPLPPNRTPGIAPGNPASVVSPMPLRNPGIAPPLPPRNPGMKPDTTDSVPPPLPPRPVMAPRQGPMSTSESTRTVDDTAHAAEQAKTQSKFGKLMDRVLHGKH